MNKNTRKQWASVGRRALALKTDVIVTKPEVAQLVELLEQVDRLEELVVTLRHERDYAREQVQTPARDAASKIADKLYRLKGQIEKLASLAETMSLEADNLI